MSQVSVSKIVRLTPEGRGAVAVLLVAGSQAAEQVGRHFLGSSEMPLASRSLNRIHHGHWGRPEGEDVVVCRRKDSEVEIHCHGGSAAADRIIADLTAASCESVAWRDWLGRRESSAIRADAARLLADARTERTAAILLDQFHGALERALADIDRDLQAGKGATAAIELETLLARSSIGRHLVEPWRVVLAGRPNVGKSSLINALVGYRRSIVFGEPGTTRDIVTVATALDGWPIELSDTAGLRASDDPLEQAGVERAQRQLATADCIVLVCDATERATDERDELACENPEAIVAYNKADLLSPIVSVAGRLGHLMTSAVTGHGVEVLATAIVRSLVGTAPRPGDAVPFTAIQISQLSVARDLVGQGELAAARAVVEALRRVVAWSPDHATMLD